MIIRTQLNEATTATKGKVRDLKLKDVDDYIYNGIQTRYMPSEVQKREITLPNDKPARIYTKGDIALLLVGDHDWTEFGFGKGCEVFLYTDDDYFSHLYNNVNAAIKNFKAIMVDLDNDENLGDIVKEYHLG